MTELIQVKNGMTSQEIADITGKQHKSILRDIRNLLAQGVAEHNFVLSSCQDKSNKKIPIYHLTPKGVLILASGYNPLLREKIINRLEELEMKNKQEEDYSRINPSDYTRQDLADIIIESEEDLQEADRKIAERDARIRELEEKLGRTRQEKIDARFERLEAIVMKMAEAMAKSVHPASALPETVETEAEDAREEAQPMLVHEMRTRIKEEHGVVIPYRRMFALLAKMGWAVRNERYINRPAPAAVAKGYVLQSDSKGVKDNKRFYTLRITEKGYRKFVDEVTGKGGLL